MIINDVTIDSRNIQSKAVLDGKLVLATVYCAIIVVTTTGPTLFPTLLNVLLTDCPMAMKLPGSATEIMLIIYTNDGNIPPREIAASICRSGTVALFTKKRIKPNFISTDPAKITGFGPTLEIPAPASIPL